ncbi:polyprenyl synthetase family protein [Bombilactobacillus thymidiniphilus]|uniref:Polyprenyl synthetase family protein n=1 Tax=Bombilactobacillus thymidiniphilus TaxID=2923363 RepID=A0ABY4PBP1_9LACO|nr:polyprenyl synthetase family protein [Bombilactobacillus thymidiniphilus]UQS82974.1 polyprenyl synthetase family protein [Bombilactobacillus thymidiniphilus]
MINPMWAKAPEINKQLEDVQAILLQRVDQLNDPMATLVKKQVVSGGKMIRPVCLLVFSSFGNASYETRIQGAAAMEILHLATLMHDDVIDDSNLRRNVETVQVKLGDRNAIYAGDYLMTVYFEIVSNISNSRSEIVLNAFSMEKILRGELDQLLINNNVNATVKMYLREVAGKTAQLIELSAQYGALLTNADSLIVHHARFIGHNLGMAFQIQDDILDYLGNKKTGKPQLEDLKNGVYTIPLIFALENSSGDLRDFLTDKKQLTEAEITYVAQQVVELGGIAAAQDLASKYSQKALRLIDELPQTKYAHLMKWVVEKLLKRQQ